MLFYMKMRSDEATWRFHKLMESLILNNTHDNDLDSVMKGFLEVPTYLTPQKNFILGFLEYLLQNSKSGPLKEMAQNRLAAINDCHKEDIPFSVMRDYMFTGLHFG